MDIKQAETRLAIIDSAEPDALRKLEAYRLEKERLEFLLSQNPPQAITGQLQAQLAAIDAQLWEIEKTAAFLKERRAITEAVVKSVGTDTERLRDNP